MHAHFHSHACNPHSCPDIRCQLPTIHIPSSHLQSCMDTHGHASIAMHSYFNSHTCAEPNSGMLVGPHPQPCNALALTESEPGVREMRRSLSASPSALPSTALRHRLSAFSSQSSFCKRVELPILAPADPQRSTTSIPSPRCGQIQSLTL